MIFNCIPSMQELLYTVIAVRSLVMIKLNPLYVTLGPALLGIKAQCEWTLGTF